MDGQVRLADGQSGPGYEYGRLEVFRRGFWGNVCGVAGFPPESAQVACAALGYDGGSPLRFPVPYQVDSANQVPQRPLCNDLFDVTLPGRCAVDMWSSAQ